MQVFVRIDLGSTTTRAVALDGAGAVLGRGVTSSRRDAEVSRAVARADALEDARLTLVRRALAARGHDPAETERLVARLEERLRFAQHLVQLKQLEASLLPGLPAIERRYPGARLEPAVREVLAGLRRASPASPASFRDVTAARWTSLARAASTATDRPYEALLAAFDEAIAFVDGRPVEVTLPMIVGVAVRDAVPAKEAHAVEAAIERAACTPLEVVPLVSAAQEATAPAAG